MAKIPICKYVAYNNPEGAKRILEAWGVPVESGSQNELARKLSSLLASQGEGVLQDIGNMHPDKDLVLTVEAIKQDKGSMNSTSQVVTSNADGGCGCGCGNCKCSEKKSGACGCSSSFAGGGAWNANEGAYYNPYLQPNVTPFAVYGADGSGSEDKKKLSNSDIFFIAVGAFLAYQLYKSA